MDFSLVDILRKYVIVWYVFKIKLGCTLSSLKLIKFHENTKTSRFFRKILKKGLNLFSALYNLNYLTKFINGNFLNYNRM